MQNAGAHKLEFANFMLDQAGCLGQLPVAVRLEFMISGMNRTVQNCILFASFESWHNEEHMVRLSNAHEYVPELYPETILCIEVYHSQRAWQKTQEFLVLGQQPWSELRDKMYCLTDQIMKKAGQHDPSGYSLIEDVFCNDLREPSAIDYSKPILDWLRESKKDALEKWECILSGEIPRKRKEVLGSGMEPKLPQFKAVKMHKTRFCDLSFRIGSGYLYCHQGACKDVIVIRDMRLIHPEDVQNRAAYPVCTFQLKMRLQKCCLQDLQSGKGDSR
ncbi:hypothetical protein RJ639_014636 [Escallonia herrerae]|uniref:snRNA-activating protein complex subunit 3 n=1 Tax=Escallonia herrerae TaxID=1293975 RepID=A0AA88VIJ0_9ASTE|nr:hypothetical protein RJ639_014636 [Escallonia herrerae]